VLQSLFFSFFGGGGGAIRPPKFFYVLLVTVTVMVCRQPDTPKHHRPYTWNQLLAEPNVSQPRKTSVIIARHILLCCRWLSNMTTDETPEVLPYRDDASTIVPVLIDHQSSNFYDQIRAVVLQVRPSLAKALDVQPLSGGLSNELFIVTALSTQTPSLVRIHPLENSTIVDRDVENKLVAWLSQQGMAPIFYGRFQNGRVEEFYNNVAPLGTQEMKEYAPKIARAMAGFHRLDAPTSILPKPASNVPSWFLTVDHWVESIRNAKDSAHTTLYEQIATEWKWLQPQLSEEPALDDERERNALRFIRERVLTHMDGQSLNILKDADAANGEGPIRLIDFEYAGWNPRAADLANTFCEFCNMNNLKADYDNEFPCTQVQNAFLLAYLEGTRLEQPSDAVLRVLRHEIGRFTLLSHLGWATWGVIMSGSAIEFNYIQYAQHRMEGYDYHKIQFFG
jgi:thiamine kinase-like enzyme